MDYFESNIINSLISKILYPIRWLFYAFLVLIFTPFTIMFLGIAFLSQEGVSDIRITLLYIFLIPWIIYGVLTIIAHTIIRKGKLFISKDHIKIMTNDYNEVYLLSEIHSLSFQRKSNFHKDEFTFGVKREFGNIFIIKTKDLKHVEHEFQIHSVQHSKEYDRMIEILRQEYGRKIKFSSI